MIHIVIEKSLGFGGGGWDTGYITYIIYQGDIIATNRESCNTNAKFVAKIFRHLEQEYKYHNISTLTAEGQSRAERLLERLLRKTDEEKNENS